VTEGTSIVYENDGIIYFDGVQQSVIVKCWESIYYLEVYAISNTVLIAEELIGWFHENLSGEYTFGIIPVWIFQNAIFKI
jgi:hypothetical protein